MNYSELIAAAPVVLVEFYAAWCPHCQRMMPVVADVKKRVEGKAAVEQIDVDQNKTLTEENGVQSYPTFILYRNGAEVGRISGEVEENALLDAINEALAG